MIEIQTKSQRSLMAHALIGVFFLAALVRFADLSTHFAHSDDIGVAKTTLIHKAYAVRTQFEKAAFPNQLLIWIYYLTGVAQHWTYAPAQFILTFFLLGENLNYRQILFWGRLPSFLFSMLGMLAMLGFYKRFERLKTQAFLIALTIMAFSWENVIYAKQMSCYAIGVFSAAVLLWLLWDQMEPGRFFWKKVFTGVLVLAVLSHTQYQILFLVPAYFATLFFYHLHRGRVTKLKLTGTFVAAGLFYAALISYMVYYLLSKQPAGAGINWNAGPRGEFQYTWDAAARPWWGNLIYTVSFFLQNSLVALDSFTAFIPESNPLRWPMAFLFAGLLGLGAVSFAQSKIFRKRILGLFMGLAALTWIGLVIKNKLALAPTRHSLILLPFACVLIAEGWLEGLKLLKRFTWQKTLARWGALSLSAVIAVLFLFHFPGIVKERQDPFDETEITELLAAHEVDTVIATGFTWNLSLMKEVLQQCNYYEYETMAYPYRPRPNPYQTIAFVSHRAKLTPGVYSVAQNRINLYQMARGRKEDMLLYPFEAYQPVFVKEVESNVETEFSRRTQNGTNNLFFYILKRIPPAAPAR